MIGVIDMKMDSGKSFRLLKMYEWLNRGDVINKKEFAEMFGISEKSVQRDIEDLRAYIAENVDDGDAYIEYDQTKKGYVLIKCEQEFLTNEEILSITKILLESRSFNKDEINKLIDKLLFQATPSAKMNIKDLILNERHNYIPPRHDRPLIHLIWELSCHISNQEIIEFDYTRQDKKVVHRTVKPLTIMFSEYYFYMISFATPELEREKFKRVEDSLLVIYRLDKIKNLKVLEERFQVPYAERFEEGEFRKRVQFMQNGPLQKVKFKYNGKSVEEVLDRIPTSRVLQENEDGAIIEAEVFGDGIKMWIRSQGELISEVSYR